MRRVALLLLLGLAALLLEAIAALHLPRSVVPNLGFLLVVCVGLHLPGARGLLTAGLLGYATDILAGALLGQHALVRVVDWNFTRIANRRLNLRRTLPLAIFAAALTVVDAVCILGVSALFGAVGVDAAALGLLGSQALVNAIFAPAVYAATRAAVAWSEPGSGRRTVRLEPRRPVVS